MELINLVNVQQILEEYAQEVRNTYQDNLITSDRLASGDLLNSIEYQVETINGTYEVQLTLADYWKYVEYDTKPHWPPPNKILEWIKIKPIIPRPVNGKIPTQKQLAFLIGRAMAGLSPNQDSSRWHTYECKNPAGGTTGTHDLEETLAAINERYKDKLVIALHQDMQQLMKVVVGNLKGEMPELPE